MKIKWYGTASLLIESGGTRILIDPYLKSLNPKLPRVPLEEAKTAQAIFITHPHLDHFCDIDAFTENGAPAVYVSENGIKHARENGLNAAPMHAMRADESYAVGKLTVRTYQSRHCKYDAATLLGIVFSPRSYFNLGKVRFLLRGMKKYKIGDDIYALEISDGEKRVMVLGSAGMDENTVYPEGCDLFVFPYQGRARMHKYMLPFLERFRPEKVMIDHFDDAFPPFSHTVNVKRFQGAVKKRLPHAEALIPVENEWYEV